MSLAKLSKSKLKGPLPGNPACPACPHNIGLKIVGKVLGDKAVVVVPAGCTSIISGVWPTAGIDLPILHVPFASAGAVASGLKAAYQVYGEDAVVVVWSGDGGAADIGFATLSGAAIRNEDIIVIVSDNEAYMNTGVQASGTTPWKALTTTSPIWGKSEERKDIAMIMLMHRIPYVATASIGYPLDFADKLLRASEINGFRFIHLHSPCPPGWRFEGGKTIELSKLAVETGAWILWEYRDGYIELSRPSTRYSDKANRKAIEEYLRFQGRYKHLSNEDVRYIEERIDESWRSLEMFMQTLNSGRRV